MSDVTRLLDAAAAGDRQASADLLARVYADLRRVAAAQLARERRDQTLDPTALVHEAYLRLVGPAGDLPFANRRHFFAAAARAMRRILVDAARRKARTRHGGGRRRAAVDLDALAPPGPADELLALHDALTAFAAHDPVKAELVELRFFGGLTVAQAAECLDMSPATAERAWRYARAWLYATLTGESPEKTDPR